MRTLSVSRGRDPAAPEKSREVVEGNYFLGSDGNADLPPAEGLLPEEIQDLIDAILLCHRGRWAISAWKASCQASRLGFFLTKKIFIRS